MRRLLITAALLAALASSATPAAAESLGPAQLTRIGWSCILPPPDFNPNVHCTAPGKLEAIISAEAELVVWLAFGTDDLEAASAPLLGTERMIRADLFVDQPCPTDPPSHGWSWLYPRFAWDYYICHTFDSPW
jgi:hypothetical protein